MIKNKPEKRVCLIVRSFGNLEKQWREKKEEEKTNLQNKERVQIKFRSNLTEVIALPSKVKWSSHQ